MKQIFNNTKLKICNYMVFKMFRHKGKKSSFKTFTWCCLLIIFFWFCITLNSRVSLDSIHFEILLWHRIQCFLNGHAELFIRVYFFLLFYNSKVKISQIISVGFKSGYTTDHFKTLTFSTEIYNVVICELLIDALCDSNLYSGHLNCHQIAVTFNITTVFFVTLLNFLSCGNAREVWPLNPIDLQTIKDLLPCRMLKKVHGCLPRSCQK